MPDGFNTLGTDDWVAPRLSSLGVNDWTEAAPPPPEPPAPPPAPAASSTLGGVGKAIAQAPTDIAGGLVKDTGAVVTGAGTGIQAAARNAENFTRQQIGIINRIDAGERVPAMDDPLGYADASDQQRSQIRQGLERDVAALPAPEATGLGQAGQAVKDVGGAVMGAGEGIKAYGEAAHPLTEEEQQRFSVQGVKMVSGLLPYIGTAVVGGLPAVVGLAGVQGFGSHYDEAKKAGASDEDAAIAGSFGGLATAGLMTVPIGKAMEVAAGLPKALKGEFLQTVWHMAESGATLTAFSQLQTIADNVVARGTYDPARDPTKGLGENLGVQFAAGAAIPLAGAAAGVAARQAGRLLPGRPNVQPRPAPAVADVLAAPDVDTAIETATQVASSPGTPVVPPKVRAPVDTGAEIGDPQQTALLRLFEHTGQGTVEQAEDGGYHYRTTDAAGAETTHPIEVWHPEADPEGGAIPPDTVRALQDHYAQAGVDVVFYKQHPGIAFDGATDPAQPDTVFLSSQPDRLVAQVANHEFTHVLQATTLPDGTNLGDLLNQQIAAGITPAGQRYAAKTFGATAPQRAGFADDASHAAAVQAHLINELGADIGGEAPKFQSFLPRVINAIQTRYGDSIAADVLGKLMDGLRATMETIRGLFGEGGTRSQNWVSNIGEVHDTLAKMYAAKFGTPVEREQAALAEMRDRAERNRFVAEPAEAPAPGVAPPTPDFGEVQGATTARVLQLRRWLDELAADRDARAAASPQARLLTQTAAMIQRQVGGGELPPATQTRLDDLRTKIDEAVHPTADTPEMATVRDALSQVRTEPAEPTEQPAPAAPGTVPPAAVPAAPSGRVPASGLESINPADVGVDAQRFQFKAGGDESGITERLQGVEKWDQRLAGTVMVWRDENGKDWIADGHQRLGLAKRLQVDDPSIRLNAFVLDSADGITAGQARAYAAAKNIAEGLGTAIDAAKVIRETAVEADVNLPPLPPRSALVRDGQSLARLSDEAFGMVVNDVVPYQQAAVVGRLVVDPAQQAEAVRVLAQLHPENLRQTETVVRELLASGTEMRTQENLFGVEDYASSVVLERAKIIDEATRQLGRDRTTFATLVNRADEIQGAGNQLATETNRARLTTDELAAEQLRSLATTRGAVSDELSAIAREFKSGAITRADAGRRFLGAVRQGAAEGLERGVGAGGAGPGNAASAGDVAFSPRQILSEAEKDRLWQELLARGERQRAVAKYYADAGQPARYTEPNSNLQYLVSKDLNHPPDGWRITMFDKAGPIGHLEFWNAQEAFLYAAQRGLTAPAGVQFSPRRLPLPPAAGTDLLGRSTPDEIRREYAEADAAARANHPTMLAATDAYRARKIGDAEYLAARQAHDQLLARFDRAYQAMQSLPPERAARTAEPTIRNDPRQVDMFGTSDAAVQAQAARDQAGRGALQPKGEQKPADEGLFAPVSAQRPLFSPRGEDDRTPLYSALTRAVEGVRQEKASPGQWIATLKNMPGVKPEERAWTGLDDWLGKQPKSVTKGEVLDYLRANSLDVREVVKGEPGRRENAERLAETAGDALARELPATVVVNGQEMPRDSIMFAIGNGNFLVRDLPEQYRPTALRYDRLLREMEQTEAGVPTETKFGTYSLPGGANYRELLITLPAKAIDQSALDAQIRGLLKDWPNDLRTARDPADQPRLNALLAEWDRNQKKVETQFTGSHWDEPNVLAHIRFDERTAPDGKRVLLVDEVQSDWHQQGRKGGYKLPEAEAQRLAAREQELIAKGADATPAERQEWADIKNRLQAQRVPDAPFKTTWPQLTMKRMIQYAVDSGFDRIAWTPGDVQAERYDLSKQISKLTLRERANGTHYLTATDHSGRNVIERSITDPAKELPDLIGKEAADKLLNQEQQTIPLLPRVRQFDLKTEETADDYRFTTLDGRSIGIRKSTFAGGNEAAAYATKYFNDRAEEINKKRREVGATRELSGLDLKVGGEGMKGFYDRMLPNEVQKIVGKFGAKVGESEVGVGRTEADTTQSVHSVDITPELRHVVAQEGLPLFSPRVAVRNERETERWTPEQAAAYAHVGRVVDAPTWRERLATATADLGRRTVRYWLDPYIGIKADDPAGYMALRNANTSAGANEMFLTDGTLRFSGSTYAMDQRNGGVQHYLVQPLHGEQDRFLWWVAAHRAERLSAEDRENLWSPKDIATIKATNQGQVPFDYRLENGQTTRSREAIYLDSLRKLDVFNKNALDLGVQSGLLNDTRISALYANPFYVPFYRVADEDGRFAGPNLTSGFVKQYAFKALKGGTQKLNNDLWDNAIKNWSHMIDASLRNRAASGVLDTAVTNGAAAERSERDLAYMAKADRRNTVWVMNNGNRQYFEISDPLLYTAVSALDFSGFHNPIMNAATKFKSLLTQGVTADPRFMLRVSIRDAEQAIATAPMSYNMADNVITGYRMGDLPGAMQNVARAVAGQQLRRLDIGAEAADVIAGGGTMRLGSGHETGARTTDLNTMLDRPTTINAFWHRISQIARAYKEVSAQSEDTQRFALYHKLIAEGVPHDQASFAARDLEDFTLKGAGPIARVLTQTVPFMNAWAQGLYKVGRAATDQDRNLAVAVGGRLAASTAKRVGIVLGTSALMTLALDAIYADDEDYKKRTDYDRDANFWFKFGGVQYRIPMGFEIAAMSRIAANGVEALFGLNEMTGRRFVNTVLQIVGTNMSLNPVPQAVSPVLSLLENKTGTGSPIVTGGMDRLRSEDQYTPGSTLFARAASSAGSAAARFIAGPQAQFLAPVQIDFLANAYFGWLGSQVVNLADMTVRAADQAQAALRGVHPNVPVRPNVDLWNYATGGMVSTATTPQSRYVDMLYQQAEGISRANATYHDLIARGRMQDAKDFFAANKDQIAKAGLIQKIEQVETTANRQIKRIGESPNLTAEQKRIEIMKYNAMRNRAAENIFGTRPSAPAGP